MISCKNHVFVAVFLLLAIVVIYNDASFDVDEHLIFRLYTRANPTDYHELKVSGQLDILLTKFNPKRPTKIFIHGYKSKEKVILRYKDAYLKLGDYNFIGVDWISGAESNNYLKSKGRVPTIASELAKLLSKLVHDRGLDLRDVTIVGHSLGAHIAGQTARKLKLLGKIGCVIGLDPAGVAFDVSKPESRLDKSDAEYVQVIHTDGGRFGMNEPIGHADFYPNAGKDQPGCRKRNMVTSWLEKCNHVRAHHLFLESLTSEFKAIRCSSLQEIQKGRCTCDSTFGSMGGNISKDSPKPIGIFYLETNDEPAFVIADPMKFKQISIVYETIPDMMSVISTRL